MKKRMTLTIVAVALVTTMVTSALAQSGRAPRAQRGDREMMEPGERQLERMTERLGLTNVTVLRARAEEVAATGALDHGLFDQVTARAVSALVKLIPLVSPLVRSGGELLFLKGARVHDEVAAANSIIRRHHLRDVEVLELGSGLVPEVTRLFRATVGGAS